MSGAIKPNCGPTALAVILSLPVVEVETAYAEWFNKGVRWQGRTHWRKLTMLAKNRFGAIVKEETSGGTLGRWVQTCCMPGRKYLVELGNHFVAIVDGRVIDQFGLDRLAELSARHVKRAFWIREKT